MSILIECLLAYVVADALIGIYHAATDRGLNVRWQVALFERHHATPSEFTLDFWAALIGVPILLCALFGWHPVFLVALGLSIALCQIPHYYAHYRGGGIVRFMQRWYLILPPRAHAVHHRDFNRNFCTLSGWNNFWLNRLLARGGLQ